MPDDEKGEEETCGRAYFIVLGSGPRSVLSKHEREWCARADAANLMYYKLSLLRNESLRIEPETI